ncbi:MAG: ATP-dependent nuclease [Clostridium sp.]
MKINSIEITNFKSIENLKIKFNKEFNLLIGKNNIGKTTIFEAMLLWGKCYERNIQKSKPRKFYANSTNIVFSEVKSLRVYEEKDLFNKVKGKDTIEVVVEIEEENERYRLGFKITNLLQEKKTYLQVNYTDKEEFKRFESLTGKYSKGLSELITISRSKPVANIARKEPYMYRDQIASKISKGKGIEVLRNKFISLGKLAKEQVERNISNIVGEEIHFVEEGNKKEYIKLKIEKEKRRIDILSQGSGFLQLVEIFTTMEYKKGILNVLLIDEPDAHLHAELHMSLVQAIKENPNSQSFVISHNERFLNSIEEENIIFINKEDKKSGLIEPLKAGSKRLVLENLVDNISGFENLQYVDKLVWLEGKGDINYIQKLWSKYVKIIGETEKNIKFNELNGVDEINIKLPTIFRIYESFIKKETEWIILRDRDLIPMNRIDRAKKEIGNCIHC